MKQFAAMRTHTRTHTHTHTHTHTRLPSTSGESCADTASSATNFCSEQKATRPAKCATRVASRPVCWVLTIDVCLCKTFLGFFPPTIEFSCSLWRQRCVVENLYNKYKCPNVNFNPQSTRYVTHTQLIAQATATVLTFELIVSIWSSGKLSKWVTNHFFCTQYFCWKFFINNNLQVSACKKRQKTSEYLRFQLFPATAVFR